MKIAVSLKDLFIGLTLIVILFGAALAGYEWLRMARARHQLAGQYLLAMAKISLLEEILDKEQPEWRKLHPIPPKLDDLPAPEPGLPISSAALP